MCVLKYRYIFGLFDSSPPTTADGTCLYVEIVINKNKGNRQFFGACRCDIIITIRKMKTVQISPNVKREKLPNKLPLEPN